MERMEGEIERERERERERVSRVVHVARRGCRGGLFGTKWRRFALGEMPVVATGSGTGGRPSPCRRAGHLIGWARREAGQPQLL